ncbi:hypothetical protein CN272_22010 [Bacillus anthracis]|nr:hypothetical protein CN272_22010 [Bacillus anthracis]
MRYVTAETKVEALKILVQMSESMNKLTEAMTLGDIDSCAKWNEQNLKANKELHKLLEKKEVS